MARGKKTITFQQVSDFLAVLGWPAAVWKVYFVITWKLSGEYLEIIWYRLEKYLVNTWKVYLVNTWNVYVVNTWKIYLVNT